MIVMVITKMIVNIFVIIIVKKSNLHLSQRYLIVEVVADVRIQLQHKVWNTGRVFVDDEVGWVVQENVVHKGSV